MDSWATQPHTPSPTIKFENSPTDSLLSTPGEMFPSLFGNEGVPTSASSEIMTPDSFIKDSSPDLALLANLTALAQTTPAPETPASASETPEPEKKAVKKRKSWGQVLPEPKTNLPPRKRAKTEDEKEQRRVERVLRNRRAAQSSRERKRQEVEGLEKRNKELEAALHAAQLREMELMERLRSLASATGASPAFSYQLDTLSQSLFSSQDSQPPTQTTTVDPAALTPISEADEDFEEPLSAATPVAPSTAPVDASPDSTQLPAAKLCQDLQCRSAEAPASTWTETSQQQWAPVLALFLQTQFLLTSASAVLSHCQRPLTQIAMSLKAGFSLLPAPPVLNTIIWLVTTPKRSHTPSTSTTTSTTAATSMSRSATRSNRSTSPTAARSQTRPSSSLRLRLLRKILTCSPILARPLRDATMEVLRLVSSEGFTVDGSRGDASAAAATDGQAQRKHSRGKPASWPESRPLPSKEALITLLWALKVEERRANLRSQQVTSSSEPVNTSVPNKTPTPSNYVLNVFSKRRLDTGAPEKLGELKRRRFA
ncbi:hypothetical protein QBC35DRAFT_75512 [Podospora australis]|uniref:BZIP domain-containing protein n=1 Tax=Podospora australis TaxID=1536484 RepID=A0AAN7AJ52_9PEZI|nr:hypothetical protein QBC35DRAFT_75512 [Podospora australis]